MNSLLNGAAAPSFDDPLEMLLACHGRITAQCDTLHKLVEHLSAHGNDVQARQAAQAILRYFDSAGRHHHEDEERDLFPHLLATSDPAARALVARLLNEHAGTDAAWQRLRPLLHDIAEDRTAKLDAKIAAHFIALFAQHIALENSQLIPLARRILNKKQLETLGHNMAVRRGVAF
ncbi:MAG: hemerythrin domain-containing protein [Sideroxydans sp.]|nr:hemerythrin domain-containing protein [Sideroxydans sp.]